MSYFVGNDFDMRSELKKNKFYVRKTPTRKFHHVFSFSSTGDECRIIIFREAIPNKAMKNHVIMSADVPNEGKCRLMCFREPNCVSINVGPLEGGKHKCELDNATDENLFTFLLEDKPSYSYVAIEVTIYILITISFIMRIYFTYFPHSYAFHTFYFTFVYSPHAEYFSYP